MQKSHIEYAYDIVAQYKVSVEYRCMFLIRNAKDVHFNLFRIRFLHL